MAGLLDLLKGWSKSNKARFDMSSFVEEETPKAHENIDNLLIANTLNRIKQASSGNWMEGLYTAQTKGGQERYIHRGTPRLGTSGAWQDMDDLLRAQIAKNPSFADTLRTEDVPGVEESMLDLSRPNIFHRLIDSLKNLF
jgi:hypothetical protein